MFATKSEWAEPTAATRRFSAGWQTGTRWRYVLRPWPRCWPLVWALFDISIEASSSLLVAPAVVMRTLRVGKKNEAKKNVTPLQKFIFCVYRRAAPRRRGGDVSVSVDHGGSSEHQSSQGHKDHEQGHSVSASAIPLSYMTRNLIFPYFFDYCVS